MLTEIDRVLVAVPDAAAAAEKWRALLGAEEIACDHAPSVSARRTTLRVGRSDIELLEPDGAGLVADELKRRGRAHLFAAGASSPDAGKMAERARNAGASTIAESDRHLVTVEIEGAPIRFVISNEAERERAGDIDFLYEATVLAADQARAVDRIAEVFGLDRTHFTTITSEAFGYTGVLTLFREGALHRFEVITPTDMQKTMGRYYAREGASFYMAFAESAAMAKIERAARASNAGVDRSARDARGNEERRPALAASAFARRHDARHLAADHGLALVGPSRTRRTALERCSTTRSARTAAGGFDGC